MEFICDSCSAPLTIPDDKISDERHVVVRCPVCREVLKVEILQAASHQAQRRREGRSEVLSPEAFRPGAGGEADTVEYFHEDAKLALVMESDARQLEILRRAVEDMGYTYVAADTTREAIEKIRFHHLMEAEARRIEMMRQAVVDLGYTYVTAENTQEAIGKLRFHQFDLIILSDRFDGIALADSPVLRFINQQTMSIRRHMFVVLLGDEFATMDHLAAFALSANLVVHRRDIDNLKPILRQAILSHQRFYRPFLQVLSEAGKT